MFFWKKCIVVYVEFYFGKYISHLCPNINACLYGMISIDLRIQIYKKLWTWKSNALHIKIFKDIHL